jgi:type IX secretion system PorP/SprF family membrane protein
MKKHPYIIYFILVFLLFQNRGYGQSVPMYSQYMYNMTNINPAYSGNRGVPSLAFIWRDQWAGLAGAPSSKSITFDMPSESKKMGYGVQLFDDRYAAVIKRTGLNLFYNIKVPVSEHGVLSLGIKGGFYNDSKLLTNVNLGPIIAYDYAYSSNMNKVVPLMGAGIFYNDDHFYAGFSAPDVVNFSNTATYKSDSSLYQINELHYFFTTGYSFDINEDVSIKPAMLVKLTSGAPIQFDFNTNVWLKNTIGIGASYRTGESILGMAEVQVSPQFRIGYAYDMTFKTPNTSELFLRLEFGRLFPNSKTYKIF